MFYWSKLYTAGFKKSKDYQELSRTIAINLLGFNVDTAADFHFCYQLLNKKTKNV
ncbi:PD-(D/E)XK nuclease family transposase [Virgibacillus dakarensis]|nr:PD-(D/E)XK nuclease family transposase [Virgibacillus dakarensis]